MAEQMKEKYEESQLYRIRHSAAHIMAEAVLEMFPEAQIAIGPPIADGFYYDFDLPRPLTPEDLKKIEKRMKKIASGQHEFQREVLSADEAREVFKGQVFKQELIDGLDQGGFDEYGEPLEGDVEISTFTVGKFTDLCRGPHVGSTKEINPKALKLMKVAGAYWRGDENKPMLQRIYGTAWEKPEELQDYLHRLEEARKRDHRRLGKDLDLYSISEDVGSGLILWHPNGAMMRKEIIRFHEDEHEKAGYDFVVTPHIGRGQLWETSGHLGFYNENMYAPIVVEEQDYYIKPMNCPFHLDIYKDKKHSYRELPIRYAEMGTVYRYERSGVLHGLLRVRGFTQDDAHHFCRPDQMPDEIDFVLNFCLHILRSFGFNEFKAYLSTMPAKSVGEPDMWKDAEAALQAALERAEIAYDVDDGGGAFYGPKIDLKIKDAIGREWQLSTIQFDFNLPERFDLTYVGEDGQDHRPYMIHRALLGSLERFFGVLIEHYGGAFPVWLSATQAVLVPIADRHIDYCYQVAKKLKAAGIRARVDDRSERMNAKIRDAQKQKIPYMLVIGDEEEESSQVALRLRSGDNPGPMSVEDFIARAKQEIADHV
jgi:threonyl-tRNA synthetase